MKINLRSKVGEDVQLRLSQGQRKEQIYNELKDRHGAGAVERSLAQWPYPQDKRNNRYLNYSLLTVTLFFFLIKMLQLIGIFQTLEPGQMPAFLPVVILPLIIYLYILYGIKNCNLIGYLLVLLFGLNTLLHIRSINSSSVIPITLAVMAMVLAWIQKTRLFPNVSFLLRHKRDNEGNIIF